MSEMSHMSLKVVLKPHVNIFQYLKWSSVIGLPDFCKLSFLEL